MTPLPELISRLRSAVHEESVLISPRTSKLIEEVKYAIGVLEGEAGLPAGGAGDMVERVARAIFLSIAPFEGVGCCNAPDFDQCRECAGDVSGIARAAIEAMREPTEDMRRAGAAADITGYHAASEQSEVAWQAMIDAALAPGRAPKNGNQQ